MTAMVTIRRFVKDYGPLASGIVVAIGLILLSIPRVAVSYHSLPAAKTMFLLEEDAGSYKFEAAQTGLRQALQIGAETAALNSDLSLLMMHQLHFAPTSHQTRADFMQVRALVETALKRRPLDAYLWTRFAHASYLIEGLSPTTLAALERSFSYGSDEPELFAFRLSVCVREWAHLPPTLKRWIRDQLVLASANPWILARVLVELPDVEAELLIQLMKEASINVNFVIQTASKLDQSRETSYSQPPRIE